MAAFIMSFSDLIIRRTLVYTLLTSSLALVYLTVVAALFTPFRRRIQAFIDRRFYRHKYNAEQVLNTFSATLREEVDLDRLSGSILGVVEETMQPAHPSLWVKEAGGKGRRTAG